LAAIEQSEDQYIRLLNPGEVIANKTLDVVMGRASQ
jgi:hypothetical protein